MVSNWFFALAIALGQFLSPATAHADLPPPLEAAAASPADPVEPEPASTLVSRLSTTVFTISLPAKTIHAGVQSCPEGMTAIGGGFDLELAQAMRVNETAAAYHAAVLSDLEDGIHSAPSGWSMWINNAGSSEGRYGYALICAPISAAISVVSSATANYGMSSGVAYCPEGMVALGGGVSTPDFITMNITASAPLYGTGERLLLQPDGANPAPTGWGASVINTQFLSWQTFKVVAICAPAVGISSVVASISLAGNDPVFVQATCPEGSFAIGGGADVNLSKEMRVSSSAPVITGSERLHELEGGIFPQVDGWQGAAFDTSNSSGTLKTAVICAQTPLRIYIPLFIP